ncbi:ABC transporter ATP-binding protein [Vampirovibrio sp.]|uniref:ABC transporter ATP-binding protein n=1 Tax=Vampirovibrio sp. TaxID=2717857 RepID=UPI0035934BEA
MNIKNDRENYLRLLGYLKPYRTRFIGSVLASIPASSLNGVLAFAVGPFLDKLVNEQNYLFLLGVPVLVFTAMLAQGFFDYISNYFSSHISYAITRDLQLELFNQLTRMDLRFFKMRTTGQVFTRFYSDCNRLQQAITSNLQGFSIEIFSFIFLAGVLFYRNWQFAFISIFIISLIALPLYFISKKIRQLDHHQQELSAHMVNIFSECINGVKEVKSFYLESFLRKRFRKNQSEFFSNLISSTKAGIMLRPLMQLISAIGFCVIFGLGILQVQSGKMTLGDVTSFLLALILLYKPVKAISSVLSKVQRIMAPAERVFELLDIKPEMVDATDAQEIKPFESLRFENVHFAYKENEPVLKNINFTLKKGEVLALVGSSGGGKTTLVDLISRFYDPDQGRVLLNEIDLPQLKTSALRDLIALVSQETILFDATIHENIRLGNLEATDADIEQAARDACLLDWVQSLPEGFNTRVGERGGMVSGGQRQRIALARAFLKNAPLLILDEATSALDNESEALIQEATMRLMKGKTVVVIAHRLSTVRFANRILVVSGGEIVESGSHEELLAQTGLYHKLYHLQFRHDDKSLLNLQEIQQLA